MSRLNDNHINENLISSAWHGQHEKIQGLLLKGADVDAICKINDSTPLMLAAGYGHHETMSVLLNNGANPNFSNKDGQHSVFIVSANHGDESNALKCLQLLVEHKVNASVCDENGRTPLLANCGNYQTSRLPIIKFLIELGANINVKDNNGNTPLMGAIFNANNNYESLRFLLNQGADIDAINNAGDSVIDIAKKYNLTDALEILDAFSVQQSLSNNILLAPNDQHR